MTTPIEGIRVGRNEDGSLDEVVVSYGISDFHIEQMDDGLWWFAVYMVDGSRHTFHLRSKKRITVTYEHEPWVETRPKAALPPADPKLMGRL